MIQKEQDTTGSASPLVITKEENGKRRGALWLQFSRRAILLLAAFAVAIFLLRLWPAAPNPLGTPPGLVDGLLINPLVLERLPITLVLLASALVLAFTLGLVLAVVAALLARLEARSPRAGALLAAFGRLALYPWMPLPVILSAFLLILLFAVGGTATGPLFAPAGNNTFTLLAGSFVLALYPALLAAQDAAQIAGSGSPPAIARRLVAALLQLGESLLLQTAGILSALTVVELIFARPGMGRLLADSLFQRDFAMVVDVLTVMALIVLFARLAAELLGWARRFVTGPPQPSLSLTQPKPPRRLWTVLAVLLLLLPLALAILGLLTSPEAAVRQDLQQRLAPPSAQHILGTDALGRDIWARLRLGSLSTLARASLVGGAVLVPALVLGLLAGLLFNRGGWLWESLADILLLPVDVLLFFPLVPAAIASIALSGPGASLILVAALALLFLPRASRAVREIWRTRRPESGTAHDLLSALVAVFLLVLFNAFLVLLAVEYLGFGPPPPAPSLGAMLQESQQHLLAAPGSVAAFVVILTLLSFALYTAAAAVSDFVDSRHPLVDFNE